MKKYITLGVIIVLLLVGVGMMKMDRSNKISEKVEEKKIEVKKSLKDLVASGTSQKCTWQINDGENNMSGVMWLSGKKFKQELTSVDKNSRKENKTVVVTDENNVYMWSSDMGQKGIKMPVSDEQSTQRTENGKVDWNTQYNYDCRPTTVADKDLAPPSDIEFQDLGVDLNQLKQLQKQYSQSTEGE